MLALLTQLFPLWALLLSVLAFMQPQLFVGIKGQIVPLLTVIMLCMGLTLNLSDFRRVIQNRKAVLVGVLLQFSLMPLIALLVSRVLSFGPELIVGMLLVGSVAGGTSSNVMCYLAKGDTALSISMTAISTLLGVVMTPVLVDLLVGQAVDVPVQSMLISLLQVVVAPVVLGVVLNALAGSLVRKVEPVLPVLSMLAIVLIIAIVVALNAEKMAQIGPVVALAVVLHNSCGLVLGYWVTALFGFDKRTCRTIAFEVGLQNSGLATALAMKFFTPAAALPGTLFSVWHNISGSLLAGYWSKKPVEDTDHHPARTTPENV
ncbi:bile acid:sodium symporter family protein [Oceanimonas baumannii]|uniref:BASS family bile acid:Na+ symporter n=1 Tax=Oceanimonas baumannii TaxID=129578 RepID=A0A235CJ00_9GAMM|nr:bile acid:sodium symporter family protein [Oceanimonas baumannii]OYD24389.1 bile acid:sodium symporter [Oceanimonas baumannii]TDW59129.1 BASS family bile acid:Na+ symporter [Oceanimonas baumannii]